MAVNNISFDTLERLLAKSNISTNDRFQIDSYVSASLVDFCNDIRPNEIEKVHVLEEKNLYRYINAACIVLGIYGKEAFDKLLKRHHSPQCIVNLHWNIAVKNWRRTLLSL